jgi:hypothetical protein
MFSNHSTHFLKQVMHPDRDTRQGSGLKTEYGFGGSGRLSSIGCKHKKPCGPITNAHGVKSRLVSALLDEG